MLVRRGDARGESRTRTGLPPADFESSAGPTTSTVKVHNRQHPQGLRALGAVALLSGVALNGRWWRHTQEHTKLARATTRTPEVVQQPGNQPAGRPPSRPRGPRPWFKGA